MTEKVYGGITDLAHKLSVSSRYETGRVIDDTKIAVAYGHHFATQHGPNFGLIPREIDRAFERIASEVDSGIPEMDPFFKRNLNPKRISGMGTVFAHETRTELANASEGILPKVFCTSTVNKNRINTEGAEEPFIIAITMSGCEQRVKTLAATIKEKAPKDREVLIIAAVNSTNDGTVNEFIEHFEGDMYPVVINEIPPAETQNQDGMTRNRLSQNLTLKTLRELEVPSSSKIAFLEDDFCFQSGSLTQLTDFLNMNPNLKVTGASIEPFPKEFLKEDSVHPVFYTILELLYRSMGRDGIPSQPHVHGSVILTRIGDHPEIIEDSISFTDGMRSNIGSGADDVTLSCQRCPDVRVYHNEATSLALWRERWKKMLESARLQPRAKAVSLAARKQREILDSSIVNRLKDNHDLLAEFIITRAAMHYDLPWQYC